MRRYRILRIPNFYILIDLEKSKTHNIKTKSTKHVEDRIKNLILQNMKN